MPSITPDQYLLAFFLQTLIYAFFCWALYRALLQVRVSNRVIPAGLVWLLLLPVFAALWNFVVVWTTASSLRKEFSDRDFEIQERPGLVYGMIYAVLNILPSILVFIAPSLFMLAFGLNIVGLVLFIMYWIKINWYKQVLEDDVASDSEDNFS